MLLEVAWKQCSLPCESRNGSSRTSCEKGLPVRVWCVMLSEHGRPSRMEPIKSSARSRCVSGPSSKSRVWPSTSSWFEYSQRLIHAADANTIWKGAAAAVMTCTYSSAAACMLASASVAGGKHAPNLAAKLEAARPSTDVPDGSESEVSSVGDAPERLMSSSSPEHPERCSGTPSILPPPPLPTARFLMAGCCSHGRPGRRPAAGAGPSPVSI
mmetsp:Transcript_18925/g.56045  ORF Transcript_18925/g.56045 Transcript_18925/m.56045 type:complete len:213 (-) Transcript_18925:729-1367(-)